MLTTKRFDVHTPDVPSDVTKRVLRAWRNALGLASIKGIVPCHALHHVTVFHATSAVQETFPAAINVLGSVAKYAQKAIAIHAQLNKMLEWICSNSNRTVRLTWMKRLSLF